MISQQLVILTDLKRLLALVHQIYPSTNSCKLTHTLHLNQQNIYALCLPQALCIMFRC